MFATRFSTTRACQSVSRMIWTSQQNCASSKSSGEAAKEKKSSSSKKKAVKTEAPAPAASTSQTFDNSSYKATEYYNHNPYTFFDLDTEMLPSRLPQPSSLKKPAS